MRVLLVSGEFPPGVGGVGDYTDRLAAALSDRQEQVGVFTASVWPTNSANTDAVWAARSGAAIWRPVARWGLTAWPALARQVRAYRPDIVHLQYQAAAYGPGSAVPVFPWLFRTWNIRPLLIVTFHDLRPPHLFRLSGRMGFDAAAIGCLAAGADACLATNAVDASALLRTGARRIWEVPIGANIAVAAKADAGDNCRRHLGLPSGAPLFASFGFTNLSKGQTELLEAFAMLVADLTDARLVYVGGGAGTTDATNVRYGEQLRQRVRELRLDDRVTFTGYMDAAAVSAHLQAADVVVLPYRDGVSLRRGTLMAALTHGCAIVTTAPIEPVPALDDAVLLYPAGDVAALASTMRQALDDAAQRRLRAAARTAAVPFEWDHIAAAHSAIYRALCHSC